MDKEFVNSTKAYEGFLEKYKESKEKLNSLKGIQSETGYVMYKIAMSSPGLSKEEKEIIKKDMYDPKWEEAEKEITSLEEKIEPLAKMLKESAIGLDKKIQEAIVDVNKSIETKNNEIKKAEEELAKQKDDLKAITESEEYKAGDKDKIAEANKLERHIDVAEKDINALKDRIKEYNKDIKDLEKERKMIISELKELGIEGVIKEDIDPKDAPEDKGGTDPKKPTEGKDDKNNPVNDDKKKNKGNQSRGGTGTVVTTTEPELTEEQKAEVERLKKEKEFKEKFTSLCGKMKKGKLEDKDFEELVAIMSDKENYDKLGITTGVIFNNKAEKIFNALKKSAKKDHEKSEKIDEAYKTYQEVFFERNDEKNIRRGYWLLSEIAGFTREQYNKKTLPAAPEEQAKPVENTNEPKKLEQIPGINNQVVEEGKFNPLPDTKSEPPAGPEIS